MFERFTERARQVVVLAQEEARTLTHDYIGTEHLLLSLVSDADSVGGRVLADLGAEELRVRDELLGMVAAHPQAVSAGDRSWLDFAPAEAFELATRLVGLAEEITFEVRRHAAEEPTFRVSCRLAGRDQVLRELVALEAVGVRALLDRGRIVRLARLERSGESDGGEMQRRE